MSRMTKLLRTVLGRKRPQFASQGKPTALILLYHRVCQLDSDPQQLCVTPQHFADHLQVMREFGNPVRLADFDDSPGPGKSSRPAIIVTFDDGYADNLTQAKPLLEKYDVSATVFVSTALTGTRHEFWWDELERLLLEPRHLPSQLDISISGKRLRYDFNGCARLSDDQWQGYRSWSVLDTGFPSTRHEAYSTLCSRLRPLPTNVRERAVDTLRHWAKVPAHGRASHRVMTADELRSLAMGGLIDVGAHTVNHPLLAALPRKVQQWEIEQSRQCLEGIVGGPVDTFSYPYGNKEAYNSTTAELARVAGFNLACANIQSPVRNKHNRFELPRLLVRDWDGDQFAKQLEHWTTG